MPRELSEEHLARLAEGRARKAQEEAQKRLERVEAFGTWSKLHSQAWRAWEEHCGKARCDCSYCSDWRWITSQIPDVA